MYQPFQAAVWTVAVGTLEQFYIHIDVQLSAVVGLSKLQPPDNHQPPQSSLHLTQVALNVPVSCLTPTQHVSSKGFVSRQHGNTRETLLSGFSYSKHFRASCFDFKQTHLAYGG